MCHAVIIGKYHGPSYCRAAREALLGSAAALVLVVVWHKTFLRDYVILPPRRVHYQDNRCRTDCVKIFKNHNVTLLEFSSFCKYVSSIRFFSKLSSGTSSVAIVTISKLTCWSNQIQPRVNELKALSGYSSSVYLSPFSVLFFFFKKPKSLLYLDFS